MKKQFFLLSIFLIPACGLTQDLQKGETVDDNKVQIFSIGDLVAKVIHRNIESEEKCPSIYLLSKDQKNTLASSDLCQIKIPGYRVFHALKDFAYIDFSNYRFQEPSTILYDVDMAILKGRDFEVTCDVMISNQKISQGECHEIE
jgi:hypothetical protein